VCQTYVLTMKRKNVHLTEAQIKSIQQLSKETGLKPAEIIRRAIDAYIKKHRRKP